MRFEELANSKERLLKDCENLIKTLKSEYAKDRLDEARLHNAEFIIESRDKLISFVEAKQKLLLEFNVENYKKTALKIEKTDENIYRQFYLLRQIVFIAKKTLKDSKLDSGFETKDSDSIFKDLSNNIHTKDFIDKITKCYNFCIKHPMVFTFILFLIGCFILFQYFRLTIGYIPNVSTDSVIYFAFLAFLFGSLVVVLFGSIFIIPTTIINEIFRDKPMLTKQGGIYVLILMFVPSVLLCAFILINTYFLNNAIANNIIFSVYVVALFIISLIMFTIIYHKDILSLSPQKYQDLFLIFVLNFIILAPILFSCMLIASSDLWVVGYFLVAVICILSMLYLHTCLTSKVNNIKDNFYIVLMFGLICLFMLNGNIIRLLSLGNYTAYYLVFDKAALDSIPKEIREARDEYYQNLGESIKLIKPKILSNIGSEYFIEMKIPKVKNLASNSTCKNEGNDDSSPTICKFKVESKFKKGEGDTIPPLKLDKDGNIVPNEI